jgi:YHS domain-containing protein
MTFIGRILRFLFWVLIVSWSVSLLRRLLGSVMTPPNRRDEPLDVPANTVARKLVRDPVCGMHIVENLALMERNGGQNVFFCSEECRSKFLGEPKKFVANA